MSANFFPKTTFPVNGSKLPFQQANKNKLDKIIFPVKVYCSNSNNPLTQLLRISADLIGTTPHFMALVLAGFFFFFILLTLPIGEIISRFALFLYPSYRTYHKLKSKNLSKTDLIKLVKFWVFISFFATAELLLGSWIPFSFLLKAIIVFHYILPFNLNAIDSAYDQIVNPVYNYIETNEHAQPLNRYLNVACEEE